MIASVIMIHPEASGGGAQMSASNFTAIHQIVVGLPEGRLYKLFNEKCCEDNYKS